MPFDLRNGPTVFQRFTNHILQSFIIEGSVLVYMTATRRHSSEIYRDFATTVTTRRLAEFRLGINMSKCKFCCSEIGKLDYIINKDEIRPSNWHIDTFPTNAIEINKCLGFSRIFDHFTD